MAGVFRGQIVTVYDIDDYTPDDDNRVTFTGSESSRWGHLIGTETADRWRPGQARPVKYRASDELATPLGGAA